MVIGLPNGGNGDIVHALQVNKTAVTNSETKSSHKLISGYWVGILDLQSLKGSIKIWISQMVKE